MCVYVCVCVCMCVCVCVCIHEYIYTHMHMLPDTQIYIYANTCCTHAMRHALASITVQVARIYTNTCGYVHIHIHKHTYTYT